MHQFSKDHPEYHHLLWQLRANDAQMRQPKRRASREEQKAHLARLWQERELLLSQVEVWETLDLSCKFDPNQPRVPAGSADGGQWTGASGTGSGNGRAWLAQERRRGSSPAASPAAAAAAGTSRSTNWLGAAKRAWEVTEHELPELGAFRRLNPVIGTVTALMSALKAPEIEYPLDEAVKQYNAIASTDDPYVVPLLGMRAKQFIRDEDRSNTKLWASVREVDKETIKQFCPEYLDVQALADRVAYSMGPVSSYGSPQNYGIQYHLRAADEVENVWRGRLFAELYLMRPMEGMPDEYYAIDEIPERAKDTLGLDVVEPVDADTACIYDFKTGIEGLRTKRIADFAFSSAKSKKLGAFKQYFFIEIKPSAGSIRRD
ncbi:hypothetical protein J2X72_001850 [Phyllobacterium sp. 1468]|uniref:hypothetical protein n=1 Tax=Phyllobacterium sp. 1468 TaxID=2817759 RepID=UPI00285D9CD7|nr:hypothetical protein [Phyllobacterium sp. 1468]MDR6633066.1 hypothetical protein [Phyllobacterium sp. 1468]